MKKYIAFLPLIFLIPAVLTLWNIQTGLQQQLHLAQTNANVQATYMAGQTIQLTQQTKELNTAGVNSATQTALQTQTLATLSAQALATQTYLETELATQTQTAMLSQLLNTIHQLQQNPTQLESATLLALEAYNLQPNPQTALVFQQAVAQLPLLRHKLAMPLPQYVSTGTSFKFSEVGHTLFAPPYLWDTQTGTILADLTELSLDHHFDLSPDNHYALSYDYQNPPQLIHLLTQQIEATLPITPSITYRITAAFSPNNQLLAYATASLSENFSAFVIQEINTGQELLNVVTPQPENQTEYYEALVFSPNGQYVAGATWGYVDIWDIHKQEIIQQIPASLYLGNFREQHLQFSPDSHYLAIADSNNLAVWDIQQSQFLFETDAAGYVHSLQFSADSHYLTISRQTITDGGEGGIFYVGQSSTQVWDIENNRLLLMLPAIKSSFVQNSHQLVTIDTTHKMQRWDIDNQRLLGQMQLPNQELHTFYVHNQQAFNHDGTLVITQDEQDQFYLWSTDFLSFMATLSPQMVSGDIKYPDSLQDLYYLNSTQLISLSFGYDVETRFWHPDQLNEQAHFSVKNMGGLKAISSVSSVLALGGNNHPNPAPDWVERGKSVVWNTQQQQFVLDLTHEFPLQHQTLSPDGQFLATATNKVELWRVATGERVSECLVEFTPQKLLFTPAGDQLIIQSAGQMLLCNPTTGEITYTLPAAGHMALHPDGHFLALAHDNSVSIWDISQHKKLTEFPAGSFPYLEFSLSGEVLAGTSSTKVEVWRTAGWELIRTIVPDSFSFTALSPDGKHVVLGHEKGVVWIVEVATGREMNRYQFGEEIYGLLFRPDGQQLAVYAQYDIYLWQWSPAGWQQLACERLSRNLTPAEWQTYLGSLPYHKTCPLLP